MQIAGLQKTTLVDFPGLVAATVFTRGCTFRCGFCHNPELVIPEEFNPLIPEEEFFTFLESRFGKLGGICITGGEPTINPDLPDFISHVKALGFKVKLDTNGTNPEMLEKIIKDGDTDYIAMDIKGPIDQYRKITNYKSQITNKSQISNYKTDCHSREGGNLLLVDPRVEPEDDKSKKLETDIKKSINLIMQSDIDYEFRTTVCHPYHEVEDFEAIGKMIKGTKRYFIQNFVKSKHIIQNINFEPFSEKELKQAKNIISKYCSLVELR